MMYLLQLLNSVSEPQKINIKCTETEHYKLQYTYVK
jgi:hypothetical protein